MESQNLGKILLGSSESNCDQPLEPLLAPLPDNALAVAYPLVRGNSCHWGIGHTIVGSSYC